MDAWKIIAIFTPITFVIYQTLSKLIPKGTPIYLLTAYASFTGALIMLLIHIITSDNKSLLLQGKALLLSLFIGFCIVMGNFLIIKAYTLGANQSTFTALFYPVLIVIGVLFGIFIWQEKLNNVQFFGMFLSIIGVVLVSYFRK